MSKRHGRAGRGREKASEEENPGATHCRGFNYVARYDGRSNQEGGYCAAQFNVGAAIVGAASSFPRAKNRVRRRSQVPSHRPEPGPACYDVGPASAPKVISLVRHVSPRRIQWRLHTRTPENPERESCLLIEGGYVRPTLL